MRRSFACLAALAFLPAAALAQGGGARVTAPKDFFKQPPGSDYFLADYTAYEAYLKRVASESDRMKLVDIGRTAEGRTQWMAIVSSPANLARLDHYRSIAERLARARGLDEAKARALAAEGKAVVWIDAGMHATEVVTSQGQIQVLHRMLTQDDPETLRMLEDTIILFAHDNPDGMELVSDWYMRHEDPKKREFSTLPRLYQKYVGHDNNRDSFTAHMPETENVNRQLFRIWYPQIVYNQHQTGPEGMVVFVPPFRDPFNHNYDPLIMTQLSEVGFAMHSRLIGEGKAGSGMRSTAPYSTWHNGMERSISYFHNSIGLLTEIIGGPTPTKIPLVPSTQLPRGDEPMPIAPQEWRLQQTLDYQWTLNRAVLDFASRNRERLLFNIWRMGMNSIERGSRDHWTVRPSDIAALEAAAKEGADPAPAQGGRRQVDPKLYDKVVRAPQDRDPRGYIIPANQRDLPTAVAFVNMLIKAGVEVDRATRAFSVGGKTYPAGSFVVRAAQAYRPHVLDMFEPQDHPNDLQYPGGPPTPPYDVAGYTLAYQMGIEFDRVLEGFDAPLAPVPDLLAPPPGKVKGSGRAGWLVGHETNNSFILTNRLLKAGIRPAWLREPTQACGQRLQSGAIWVPATGAAAEIVRRSAGELGIGACAVGRRPAGASLPLKPVRIGLVDRWGGIMSSGWTRWLLERFEFPFEVVFPQRLDAGNLRRDFDMLVFTDGAIPWSGGGNSSQPKREETPAELAGMLGGITEDKTVPAIGAFVREGGSAVAIGSSTRLATLLKAPVTFALTESKDGTPRPLDTKSFYIPGSVLRARVDNRQPLAYGMPDTVDMFFNRAQTFRPAEGLKKVSWFEGTKLLRSGWAVGEEKLDGTVAVAEVDVGRGNLFLMGPEVMQRAQPYGTFKFLFNALLYGPAETAGQ
ncbi:MAG TPA: M14 metallopeptidase family protein [Allosphingosinicella sp.]|jgi:hypothetical protein